MSTISSKKKNSAARSLPRKPRNQIRRPTELVRGKRIAVIQRALLRWYKDNGRDLPWRHTRNPYRILVSEIMLQQTQVDRVIPKYRAFLKAFPTVQHLALAPLSGVIRAWVGLGYNRRAVYLHEAAKVVVEKFGGRVPVTIPELEALPGVGAYTAGAIACFAGGSREAFLDTNIKRVIGRLFLDVQKKRLPNEKDLFVLAEHCIPATSDDAYAWHHALMDLGALVCTAAKPKCEKCPLKRVCPFPPFRKTIQKSHYAKPQSVFKNSDRFWRGRILAIVGTKTVGASLHALVRHNVLPVRRIKKIVRGLCKDGLLVHHKGHYHLPP